MPGLTSQDRARGVRKYSLNLTHSPRYRFQHKSSPLTWPTVREIPAPLGYSEYSNYNQGLEK